MMTKHQKCFIAAWLVALAVGACALLTSGCASYTTNQKDISYDSSGAPLREITTKVKVGTFWDSDSALATSRATNTDKAQSSELGGLAQSSTSTNIVNALQAISEIISNIK